MGHRGCALMLADRFSDDMVSSKSSVLMKKVGQTA